MNKIIDFTLLPTSRRNLYFEAAPISGEPSTLILRRHLKNDNTKATHMYVSIYINNEYVCNKSWLIGCGHE